VSAAACLAIALAIRVKCVLLADTTDRDRHIVDHCCTANTMTRAVVAARVRLGPIQSVLPLLARHSIVLLIADTLAELLRAHSIARAVVGARVLVHRAISTLPLMVAVAGSVVADTIVRAVVGAVGHGAVKSRPASIADTLHSGS